MGETENILFSSRPVGRDVLLHALRSFAAENFSVRLPEELDGVDEELIRAFNAAAETNERLSRQAADLARQSRELAARNEELRLARTALEAADRPPASSPSDVRRRAEVLADFSRELRAPLGSMLTLAKLLVDNGDSSLSSKQVDYAQTIYSSGTDLLSLIDDILDLARAGSGTLALNIAPERFSDLRDYFLRAFRQTARDKGLHFEIDLAPDLPSVIDTDVRRLRQILKNLLSNSFRFTARGSVVLSVAPAPGANGRQGGWVAFSVADTGIGIPDDRQRAIFEAPPDAVPDGAEDDSPTLSVCRELSHLLGGDIAVDSEPGRGARFTLTLPVAQGKAEGGAEGGGTQGASQPGDVGDSVAASAPEAGVKLRSTAYYGRRSRRTDDATVLVAEGDPRVASVMLGLVRNSGYQGVVVCDGDALAAALRDARPDAIILGDRLRDSDGREILATLRRDPVIRLLPICMTSVQPHGNSCLQISGAADMAVYEALPQPLRVLAQMAVLAGRAIGRVMLAPALPGKAWQEAIRGSGVTVMSADSGAEVIAAAREGRCDGVVLGPALHDMNAIELLGKLALEQIVPDLPVALLDQLPPAGGDLPDGALEIAILRKRDRVEKILDETTAFLERTIGNLPRSLEETPCGRRKPSADLAGKRVMLIERDVRTVFALTAALEENAVAVLHAEDADAAAAMLGEDAGIDIDAILIGLASPATGALLLARSLRDQARYRALPMIALADDGETQDERHEEREMCLLAGISDYIARPVNIEHLLSLLRVWLVQDR